MKIVLIRKVEDTHLIFIIGNLLLKLLASKKLFLLYASTKNDIQ
jgi:hypothetical protein